MRALETIGFSLVVIAICVGLLVFLMGGPHYQGSDSRPDRTPRTLRHPLRR